MIYKDDGRKIEDKSRRGRKDSPCLRGENEISERKIRERNP
jgi:hypothetical protein